MNNRRVHQTIPTPPADNTLATVKAQRDRLHTALCIAADDLDKAANQFAGLAATMHAEKMRTLIVENPRLFAFKAQRAREEANRVRDEVIEGLAAKRETPANAGDS